MTIGTAMDSLKYVLDMSHKRITGWSGSQCAATNPNCVVF